MQNPRIRLGMGVLGCLLLVAAALALWPADSEEAIKLKLPWAKAESQAREGAGNTALILDALELRAGLRVADVGAGGGFFTFLMASQVGPAGTVLATDIDPLMVSRLQAHKRRNRVANVRVRQTDVDGGFGLGVNSLDRILLSNVFPFSTCDEGVSERLLSEAHVALRPGGRLVLWSDWVHLAGWTGSYGKPRECDDLDATGIAAMAGTRYSVESFRPSGTESNDPLERPGYLVVLEPLTLADSH